MSEAVDLALYAGSFDPPTYGHLDLVERAARLFPRVIVAVGMNPTRSPLFSVAERLDLLTQICASFANVTVESFDGLLVDYGKRVGARVVVRGQLSRPGRYGPQGVCTYELGKAVLLGVGERRERP